MLKKYRQLCMSNLYKKIKYVCLLPMLLLAACNTVVLNSSGYIAQQQGDLIIIATVLMLIIVVPVITLICVFAWRYRKSNISADYQPTWHHSTKLELVIWLAPLCIIIILGIITWITTHRLDPYRPLDHINKTIAVTKNMAPVEIEVVALDWKWLFIYPKLGVATVNQVVVPVDTPIHFKITSSTVMNSFYVPALAGQIYAMPGMQTTLNAVINQSGIYNGFSSNYSGAGFSNMRFKFYGISQVEYEKWISATKRNTKILDQKEYLKLVVPSQKDPVQFYGTTDPMLYFKILNKCVALDSVCEHSMHHTVSH
jgi:cytochrome o ubiquinol oxidase subunit 2